MISVELKNVTKTFGDVTAVDDLSLSVPEGSIYGQAAPGGVPVWQPIVGITGVILFAIFCVWVGGRVFRVGLLVQGKIPKLKNIIRIAVRG